MDDGRTKKIKALWEEIHGEFIPSFYWQFHPDMQYWYNEDTDRIECVTGLSIPVILKDDELNERNLRDLIWDMENKIYADYKNMGWDLGYWRD